jgi:uncharacterized protein
MKHGVLVAVLLAFLISAPSATGYPQLYSYVTDESGVLLSDEVVLIENVCQDIYATTGCEMAVLIVPTTEPDTILIYGVETFELNALGQEGKDNGLLLIVATDDNEWRIEVGYGLQDILSASRVGSIGDTIIEPNLTEGNYFTGIGGAVSEIAQIILDEYDYEGVEPPKSKYPISFIPLTFWQLVLVFGIIVFLTVITKGRILFFIPMLLGKGGGKIGGGGRSGGGGAGGKW